MVAMIGELLRSLPPVFAILLVSLFISLLITVVYKFATNQTTMKGLHQQMKDLRSQIRENKDPATISALNSRLMKLTMQQATHSMRSTIITIVPLFLLFGWMQGNFAYMNVAPGEQFETSMDFIPGTEGEATLEVPEGLSLDGNATQVIADSKVAWKLSGPEGSYKLLYDFNSETYGREVIITNSWHYTDPVLEKGGGIFGFISHADSNPIPEGSSVSRISVGLRSVHPFGGARFFGWQPGWLAVYFLFTVFLSFPMRKLLKVY